MMDRVRLASKAGTSKAIARVKRTALTSPPYAVGSNTAASAIYPANLFVNADPLNLKHIRLRVRPVSKPIQPEQGNEMAPGDAAASAHNQSSDELQKHDGRSELHPEIYRTTPAQITRYYTSRRNASRQHPLAARKARARPERRLPQAWRPESKPAQQIEQEIGCSGNWDKVNPFLLSAVAAQVYDASISEDERPIRPAPSQGPYYPWWVQGWEHVSLHSDN